MDRMASNDDAGRGALFKVAYASVGGRLVEPYLLVGASQLYRYGAGIARNPSVIPRGILR